MAVPNVFPSVPPTERREAHPTLYFPDGDLVLAAPTGPVYDGNLKVILHMQQLFRVHRFILRHNSPVFADMLSLPMPDDGENGLNEMWDGVPLVVMQDNACDLACLLNALYNPATLLFKRMDPNTPFYIGGILRLAQKYAMELLHTRLLEHWAADWPQTLADMDSLAQKVAAAEQQHRDEGDGKIDGLYLDDRFPEPALAIRTARDFSCPKVLPAAFYRVACTESKHDWTLVRRQQQVSSPLRRGVTTVRWNLLTHTDLMRVIAGREYLIGKFSNLLEMLTSDPDSDCCRTSCSRMRTHLRTVVVPPFQERGDILAAANACMKRELEYEEEWYSSCADCAKSRAEELAEFKEDVWTDWQWRFMLGASA